MPGWRDFFDSHAPHYEDNAFTQNTRAEVEFLQGLFQAPAGSTLLDLGCGTGRHARHMAERGWAVTGVDLSEGMLKVAREKAGPLLTEDIPRKGQVRFIHADAQTWVPDLEFDAVICLCEGGLGLIGDKEDPVAHELAILRTAYRAARPNALFVLTCLNGYAFIRQAKDDLVTAGRFDPGSMMAIYEDEWDLPEGKQTMQIRERLFIAPEYLAMLRHVGWEPLNLWGGTAGDWGERPLKLDEVEMMIVSRKP